MSKEIVFDIETIGDIKDISTMEVTVVSIYDYGSDRFSSFERSELGILWPILEKAERLIGYNSEHFDLPILNKYYPGDLLTLPHLDLLKVIKESTGKRFKLNDIAEATLDNMVKSADGMQAIRWWQEGKLEELKKYCEQDVRVTKEIYEFGCKNKQLFYKTIIGETMPFRVNFDLLPQDSRIGGGQMPRRNINLTLPI